MNKARWIWAAGVTVAILTVLGAGLWFGGGPTTRNGWESASWAAGIAAALWLAVTALARSITGTSPPPPTSSESDSDVLDTLKVEAVRRTPAPNQDALTEGSLEDSTREIEHTRSLASAHRENIRILEQQIALFGPLHTPPHKQIEMELEKEKLERIIKEDKNMQ